MLLQQGQSGPVDPPRADERIVTDEELLQHKSEGDAWIVVDEKVYDVSEFLESHPGGRERILKHLHESNAGNLMRGNAEIEEEKHVHSPLAFRILQRHSVGALPSSTVSVLSNEGRMMDNTKVTKSTKFEVDMSKPLVAQVGYLGADYDDWVHDPIVCKETPRFFENDILESLTRTRWWVIPLVWCPVSFGMFHVALKNGMTTSRLPYMITAGVLFWTFLEYVLHRFLFHMKASGFWTNTAHYMLHGFHHKHPMDGSRLVMPPAMAAPIVVAIWLLMGDWVAAYPDKLVLYGGTILAYVSYDLTHYYLHFGKIFDPQMRAMKRYHMNHHFNDQGNGYGITSRFWDRMFRTLPEEEGKKMRMD